MLQDHQVVEALNVDWAESAVGRKRPGSTALAMTGGTAPTTSIEAIFRHVPGSLESEAELWLVDAAATPVVKRLTGGTTWADVTMPDVISSAPQEVDAVSFNGKLFLAFDSIVDQLHVYDAGLSSPKVRRVGLNATLAPTATNTGSGSYTALLRYYRIYWTQITSGRTVRRSESSPSVSFTPSGSGTHARVAHPGVPNEDATHWNIEISLDNVNWYELTSVVVATGTYDDNSAVATYILTATVSNYAAGLYGMPPSARYLLTDGNRLLMGGTWELSGSNSSGRTSRVWFTPVLGDADKGDDERIPNTTTRKNWVDLNESDGGAITALAGPLNGIPFAGKYRQLWKLIPTGDVLAPYQPRKLTDAVGIIHKKAACLGEDELGRPALYFMSHKGPYRYGAEGLQYIGRDNEDIWRVMNLAASKSVAQLVWYADLHQVWVFVATGSATDPDVKMLFDVQLGRPDSLGQVRGGWAKHTGPQASARCSVMFANTVGATMSRDLRPYIGKPAAAEIWKCYSSATTDASTAYQAYLTTKPIYVTGDIRRYVGLGEPSVIAKVGTPTLTVTMSRDFGVETRSGTTTIAAVGSETRVIKKVEGLEWEQVRVAQVTVGDGSALDSAWTLDGLVIPVTPEGVA